jgi:hypothetical protein
MKRFLAIGRLSATMIAAPASAKDNVVKMLTKGATGMMVFEPRS